jgi:hypothetical protein
MPTRRTPFAPNRNHASLRRRAHALAIVVPLAIGTGLMAALGGCYSRVVESKGFGAAQTEPEYRSNTALDRAYDRLTETPEPERPTRRPLGGGAPRVW